MRAENPSWWRRRALDLRSLFVAARCAAALCPLLAAPSLPAHPISIITGEALVRRDKVEMAIAVMPEDFLPVYGLFANAESRIATDDIARSAEKHKGYLLDGLVVRDADGNRLAGRVVKVEMPALPAEGLPVADLMATTIVYRLEFPLAKPPPHLSFQQHFGGDEVLNPVMAELVVTREGLPPEPPINIPGDGHVVVIAFDWNETSRPVAGGHAEARAREEEKRRQDMGITSYSATYTFIYIRNDEVRIEILMPLLTLEMWQPVARKNADFIEVSEQLAARGTLEKFLTGQNELKIDGVTVKPRLDRLDFYGVDFKDFAMRAEPRRLSAWTARVGAILAYSTKGAPGRVDLRWTLFNNEMLVARAAIFAYGKGSRFAFYPRDPVFKWDNPGAPRPQAVASVSAGERPGAAIAESLLRNVYRAFDYRDESDIYDALARSAQGDLLADLYLKVRQGLIMREQDGAVANVTRVDVIKTEPVGGGNKSGFSERVTWRVEGTVEHWGHIHTRVNEYSASLDIAPVDGAWKITGMQVNRQSLVRSSVSLQKI